MEGNNRRYLLKLNSVLMPKHFSSLRQSPCSSPNLLRAPPEIILSQTCVQAALPPGMPNWFLPIFQGIAQKFLLFVSMALCTHFSTSVQISETPCCLLFTYLFSTSIFQRCYRFRFRPPQ